MNQTMKTVLKSTIGYGVGNGTQKILSEHLSGLESLVLPFSKLLNRMSRSWKRRLLAVESGLILLMISLMVKSKMFCIYARSLMKTLKPVRSERLLPNALLMRLSLELASVKWLLRKLKKWLQRQSQSWVVTFKRLVLM